MTTSRRVLRVPGARWSPGSSAISSAPRADDELLDDFPLERYIVGILYPRDRRCRSTRPRTTNLAKERTRTPFPTRRSRWRAHDIPPRPGSPSPSTSNERRRSRSRSQPRCTRPRSAARGEAWRRRPLEIEPVHDPRRPADRRAADGARRRPRAVRARPSGRQGRRRRRHARADQHRAGQRQGPTRRRRLLPAVDHGLDGGRKRRLRRTACDADGRDRRRRPALLRAPLPRREDLRGRTRLLRRLGRGLRRGMREPSVDDLHPPPRPAARRQQPRHHLARALAAPARPGPEGRRVAELRELLRAYEALDRRPGDRRCRPRRTSLRAVADEHLDGCRETLERIRIGHRRPRPRSDGLGGVPAREQGDVEPASPLRHGSATASRHPSPTGTARTNGGRSSSPSSSCASTGSSTPRTTTARSPTCSGSRPAAARPRRTSA